MEDVAFWILGDLFRQFEFFVGLRVSFALIARLISDSVLFVRLAGQRSRAVVLRSVGFVLGDAGACTSRIIGERVLWRSV